MATSFTEQEILSQPKVWQTTLENLSMDKVPMLFPNKDSQIIVTGCGSTYYLSQVFAVMLTSLGYDAVALPASELLSNSDFMITKPEAKTFVAISRSGATTETIEAVKRFQSLGGTRVGVVTCYPDSELALLASVVISVPESQEQSVAQTRSFSTMLLVCQAIIGTLRGESLEVLNQLPGHAERLIEETRDPMRTLAQNMAIDKFSFLASGRLFGVAAEGMLKLKEMSLTVSEAFHALEFRHGPMSMCDSSSAVIALVNTANPERDLAVIHDLTPMVGEMITIGANMDSYIPHSLPSWCQPVLYLIPLQLLALERSLAKGLNPDKPRNLSAVIHLETAN